MTLMDFFSYIAMFVAVFSAGTAWLIIWVCSRNLDDLEYERSLQIDNSIYEGDA